MGFCRRRVRSFPRPRPPALPGSAWRASSQRVLRALFSRRYVHRLIYSDLENEPDVEDAETGDGAAALDESGEASIPRLRMKLVEMAHPSTQLLNRSGERSQRPTPARLSELAQARSLAAHARRRSRVGVLFAHARDPPTGRYRGRGGRPHPSETREPRVQVSARARLSLSSNAARLQRKRPIDAKGTTT